MSARADAISAAGQGRNINVLKWVLAVLLLGAGIAAFHYFDKVLVVYRILGLIPVSALSLLLALKTEQGLVFWGLLQESYTELRRIVWPTGQETRQTTLVVVAVVFIVALLLWGLDAVFGRLISLMIG